MAMRSVADAVAEETLGEYVARLRGNEGLTDVARRMNYRITPQGLANIENGASKQPKPATLWVIAEAYAGRGAEFWDLMRRAKYHVPDGVGQMHAGGEYPPLIRAVVGEIQRLDEHDREAALAMLRAFARARRGGNAGDADSEAGPQ